MIIYIKRLFDNSGFLRYLKNTSWLLVEKALRLVVGLFIGVWVARYLGPAQFGLLNYAQAFVALFSAIATLELDGIVIREIAKDESKKGELIGTAFWLKVMGAIATFIILAIVINFTSNDNFTNLLIFIIASSTIFQSLNVIDMYFQAKVLVKYIALANSISLLISSIVKVILILAKAPLIYFAVSVLFDSLILALGYIYFYFKNMGFFLKNLHFKKDSATALLRDSWPLVLSGIVIMIYMRIDQVMIQNMLGSEATGIYSAAVRISEAWYFIPMVITSSLFPAIINSKKHSENLY